MQSCHGLLGRLAGCQSPEAQSDVEKTVASPEESVHSSILGTEQEARTVESLSFRQSTQNRRAPSGLGTRTTGLAHSALEDSMTSAFDILSTSTASACLAAGPASARLAEHRLRAWLQIDSLFCAFQFSKSPHRRDLDALQGGQQLQQRFAGPGVATSVGPTIQAWT